MRLTESQMTEKQRAPIATATINLITQHNAMQKFLLLMSKEFKSSPAYNITSHLEMGHIFG